MNDVQLSQRTSPAFVLAQHRRSPPPHTPPPPPRSMWKRKYWAVYRAVFLVWHRYAKLMMVRLSPPVATSETAAC